MNCAPCIHTSQVATDYAGAPLQMSGHAPPIFSITRWNPGAFDTGVHQPTLRLILRITLRVTRVRGLRMGASVTHAGGRMSRACFDSDSV
jgi:hypothetical protein